MRIAILCAFLSVSSPVLAQEGFATFYTEKSCQAEGNSGKVTASGEVFDEGAMTCALRRRDWGSEFVVYGQKTERSVVVRLNDFGPGRKPTKRGVIIDLTPMAFKKVCGDISIGKCLVNVQEVQ